MNVRNADNSLPNAPVAAAPASVAAPVAPVSPVMAPDQFVRPPLPPASPTPRVQRSPGGWDDLVAVLASFGLSFPLAGVGALAGVFLGNPVLGASLAVAGGSALGVLLAGHELWAGTRPGANPPVRWKMVLGSLIPAGLTLAGAGVGALVAGAGSAAVAGAVATGAVIGVSLPWLLLVGNIIRTRLQPVPPPVEQPTHPDNLVPAPETKPSLP